MKHNYLVIGRKYHCGDFGPGLDGWKPVIKTFSAKNDVEAKRIMRRRCVRLRNRRLFRIKELKFGGAR